MEKQHRAEVNIVHAVSLGYQDILGRGVLDIVHIVIEAGQVTSYRLSVIRVGRQIGKTASMTCQIPVLT